MKKTCSQLLRFFALVVSLAAGDARSQVKFTVTDLAGIPTGATPAALSDSGHVVGLYIAAGNQGHGFIWKDNVLTDIPGPGGMASSAVSVNDAGQVLLIYPLGTGQVRSFVWQNGVTTDLGTFGGRFTTARDINNSGLIVGHAEDPSTTFFPFLYNGALIDIRNPGSTGLAMMTQALYINDAGQATGSGRTAATGGDFRLCIWENGAWSRTLEPLSGSTSSGGTGVINNHGHVVGVSDDRTGMNARTTLWKDGAIIELGTLSGAIASPVGINDAGQIIGIANTSSSGIRPFLWENGVMQDLNDRLIEADSGWVIASVVGINNSGQILGSGRLNNGPSRVVLLVSKRLDLASPGAGDLLIAGEPDTIRWSASGDIEFVDISFSRNYQNQDNQGDYITIVENHPAASGKYVWQVPDTLLSRKCNILIQNSNEQLVQDTSGVFKVKGYELTRVTAAGDYERFNPRVHGWSFVNASPNMWPPTWYQQFNYNGIDPISGFPYSPDFTSWPFSAKPGDFPDWPLFVTAFGVAQCYFEFLGGLNYRFSALVRWALAKGDWGGSCHGFALSSFLTFDRKPEFVSAFPQLPVFNTLFQLPISDPSRATINQLWIGGLGKQERHHRAASWNKTVGQTVRELQQMFLSEAGDNRPLYLSPSSAYGSGAHSINPYRLKKNRTNPGIDTIYVYDNNAPGFTNRRIIVDTSANKWDYQILNGWKGDNDLGDALFLNLEASAYLANPLFQRSSDHRQPASVSITAPAQLEFYNLPGTVIAISNGAGGSIGFDGTGVINTFTNGIPLIPATGYPQPPLGYYVPEGEYAVRMRSFKTSGTRFTVITDSLIMGCDRLDADSTQTDRLIWRNGLGFQNSDAGAKSLNFAAILVEATRERMFQIQNASLRGGDSLHVTENRRNDLNVQNHGAAKTYDLALKMVSTSRAQTFEHRAITLAANASHQVCPNWDEAWDDLTAVKILIDNGNDGTIDDSMSVDNQSTAVEAPNEANSPHEYRLYQNYPNPFNASTEISFAVPRAGRVSLKIYDVVGREVATLVEGEVQPGLHRVKWEAGGLPSGMYFYRLQSGEVVVEVKAMLLLK
ncbi:MAG: T9SS type A sorting domain-containing protein [bacterium]